MSGADVWRVLRANMWLILGMLTISIVAGYFVNRYLASNYSRYTAMGFIEVHPAMSSNPLDDTNRDNGQTSVSLEQRTQVQLLKTQTLLSEVLQNSKAVRETSWFQQFNGSAQKAKKDLTENLSVSPITETKLIAVSVTYSKPADCATLVYEIVQQHLQNESKRNNENQYEQNSLLTGMRVRSQTNLNRVSEKVRAQAVKLGIDGIGVAGRISVKDQELSSLVQLQLQNEMKADAARSQRDAVVQQLKAGQDPTGVDEAVRTDATVAMYRQMVTNSEMQASELERMVGPKSPQMTQATARRDAMQQKLDSALSDTKAKVRVAIVEGMESQLGEAQQALDKVASRVNELKRELGDLSNDMAEYLTLKDEEETFREQVNAINRKIEQMNTIQGRINLSTVSWSTKPEAPENATFPKLSNIMAMSVFVGLAISLGIAFLREILDTSVRSPRDIQRIGQMSMLGMIAHESDDPQSAGARLPLVIFEAPHSMLAEQFRQVRTRLQHASSLDTTRSILVTSPSPGDGKSIVATNLAAGLALNGRRILLVDANFRRPELHKIFGLGNEAGLSDVLNNLDSFDTLVQETSVPNLSVLPSGAKPTNATELMESQLLIDFIERALEEFDHVIFDSGPMLFVSESVALAPRVDGVVTVVRARSNSRGLLQRMRDGLRQVKAEHLGVVLNAVRSQGGGYYGRNIKTYYEYQNAG